MSSFKAWLQTQEDDEFTEVGDFARDVAEDPDFPETRSRSVVRSYLEACGAEDLVMLAFENAFNQYEG
ncbi:hypothetical protein HDU86_000939 [Geranomyces michiganensis]|nr:hypothetical protein HDU86_000939 [Geranomyces michiganensis]